MKKTPPVENLGSTPQEEINVTNLSFRQSHIELDTLARSIEETAQIGICTSREAITRADTKLSVVALSEMFVGIVYFILRLVFFITQLISKAEASLREWALNRAKERHEKVVSYREIANEMLVGSATNSPCV